MNKLCRVGLAPLVIGAIMTGAGCGSRTDAAAQDPISSEQATFELVTVAGGLEHPWGMAFVPDGGVLVTERPGRLRIVRDGQLVSEPIEGVPPVYASGQGGLLDVALNPEFASNRLIYLSYAAEGEGGNSTRVARAISGDGRLENVQVIFTAEPLVDSSYHFGSRLAFDAGGHLFITVGERHQSERAQDLADLNGSVIRLYPDGSVPEDNPFVGTGGARPRSSATAIAIRKAWRSTRRPASPGCTSTARAAATRSTSCDPA